MNSEASSIFAILQESFYPTLLLLLLWQLELWKYDSHTLLIYAYQTPGMDGTEKMIAEYNLKKDLNFWREVHRIEAQQQKLNYLWEYHWEMEKW